MPEPTKRCAHCGLDKPTAQFRARRDRVAGLQSRCRECERSYHRGWREANIETELARDRAWYAANRDAKIAKRTAALVDERLRAVEVYGGRCAQCASTDRLEFDHVNGDGAEHREIEHAQTMYRRIARSERPLADHLLQLLCFNCHRIKTAAERTCRREASA